MLGEQPEYLAVQDAQEIVRRDGIGIWPHNCHGTVTQDALSRINGEVFSKANLA
jgi:hypothetical protein